MTTPPPDDTRTMHERMLASDLYIADDPEIAEAANVSHDLMGAYNATTRRQEPSGSAAGPRSARA
jgi:maltose O-acetyltransferase